METKKAVLMNLWQGRNKDVDVENGLEDIGGGEVGMKWESSTDIYTLPNVKWMASGKLLHSPGRSAGCFVMT